MNITEKIFALQEIPLFSQLQYSELLLITEVTSEGNYPPGKLIVPAGTILQKLYIVVNGGVTAKETNKSAPIFGVCSLIFDEPVPYDLKADSEHGAKALVISKGHFFTIINECPELVINFLKYPVS